MCNYRNFKLGDHVVTTGEYNRVFHGEHFCGKVVRLAPGRDSSEVVEIHECRTGVNRHISSHWLSRHQSGDSPTLRALFSEWMKTEHHDCCGSFKPCRRTGKSDRRE